MTGMKFWKQIVPSAFVLGILLGGFTGKGSAETTAEVRSGPSVTIPGVAFGIGACPLPSSVIMGIQTCGSTVVFVSGR